MIFASFAAVVADILTHVFVHCRVRTAAYLKLPE
jgi:hypothetical protein